MVTFAQKSSSVLLLTYCIGFEGSFQEWCGQRVRSGWQHLLPQGEELTWVCWQERTLGSWFSLLWYCSMFCEVWRPDFWSITSLFPPRGRWWFGEHNQHEDLPHVPMGGLTSHSPKRLGILCWPRAFSERTPQGWAAWGSMCLAEDFMLTIVKAFKTALNWFVYKTQSSVTHYEWSALLWACTGFVLQYKR